MVSIEFALPLSASKFRKFRTDEYGLGPTLLEIEVGNVWNRCCFDVLYDYGRLTREGAYFDNKTGNAALVYHLHFDDTRSYNIFKLKIDPVALKSLNEFREYYEKNERERWGIFNQWFSDDQLTSV